MILLLLLFCLVQLFVEGDRFTSQILVTISQMFGTTRYQNSTTRSQGLISFIMWMTLEKRIRIDNEVAIYPVWVMGGDYSHKTWYINSHTLKQITIIPLNFEYTAALSNIVIFSCFLANNFIDPNTISDGPIGSLVSECYPISIFYIGNRRKKSRR